MPLPNSLLRRLRSKETEQGLTNLPICPLQTILHLFAYSPISAISVSSSKLPSLLLMHGYTALLLQWTHSGRLDSNGPLTFSFGICQFDQPLIIGVSQFYSISISKWSLLHN